MSQFRKTAFIENDLENIGKMIYCWLLPSYVKFKAALLGAV
jgi:hypothetical protein